MTYHATQRIVFPHKHTPSLSLHSEIHYSRDTSCPDACSASPSSATRIYGHVQLSCSPYTLPDWAVRCLFHSPKGTFRLFLHHCHLPKRHFVDLHLSTFALEQEDTWVERPEEEEDFWPATFLLCPSFLSSVFLFSHHPPTPPIQAPPNQNLSFSFSHPHPHPHPFNPKSNFKNSKFNSPTSTSPAPHKPHSSPRRQLFSETTQTSTPNVLSSPIVLGVASFRSSMCMRRGRRRLLSL